MAEVTKPIALDESFNTTEATPRNIADVLAAGLSSANELSDLDDVTINTSTLENRQGLIYNSTTDTWTNGTVATSIDCTQAQYDAWKSTGQLVVGTTYMIKDGQNVTCDLGDLDDVTISSASNGDVLAYNNGAWVNSDCVKLFNITKHYASGSSTDALNDLITTYGKVNMMFAYDTPVGYFTGILTFQSSTTGSGYIIQTSTGRFWVVGYASGTITLYEKT